MSTSDHILQSRYSEFFKYALLFRNITSYKIITILSHKLVGDEDTQVKFKHIIVMKLFNEERVE